LREATWLRMACSATRSLGLPWEPSKESFMHGSASGVYLKSLSHT
jgi:hypothetical protein